MNGGILFTSSHFALRSFGKLTILPLIFTQKSCIYLSPYCYLLKSKRQLQEFVYNKDRCMVLNNGHYITATISRFSKKPWPLRSLFHSDKKLCQSRPFRPLYNDHNRYWLRLDGHKGCYLHLMGRKLKNSAGDCLQCSVWI